MCAHGMRRSCSIPVYLCARMHTTQPPPEQVHRPNICVSRSAYYIVNRHFGTYRFEQQTLSGAQTFLHFIYTIIYTVLLNTAPTQIVHSNCCTWPTITATRLLTSPCCFLVRLLCSTEWHDGLSLYCFSQHAKETRRSIVAYIGCIFFTWTLIEWMLLETETYDKKHSETYDAKMFPICIC